MVYASAEASKFSNLPVLPVCVTVAVQSGDPFKGPAILLMRAKAGCVIPWHWHSKTSERLMMVRGSLKAEMKGMKPNGLKPGDMILLPSKGIHQLTALTSVEFFNTTDAPFDIHYVDADEKEIPVETALKARPSKSPTKTVE